MNAGNILVYIGLFSAGVTTLWLAAALYRRYPLKPLLYYLVSIAAFLSSGFLDVMGNFVTQELLAHQAAPRAVGRTVAWVFGLLSLPFAVAAMFAFIAMVLVWGGRRFTPAGKTVFFSVQGGMVIFFAFAGYETLFGRSLGVFGGSLPLRTAIDAVNLAILLPLLLALLGRWLKQSDQPLRVGIGRFALFYLVLWTARFILVDLIQIEGWSCVTAPLFAFLLHLPPLLYLRYFLDRHFRNHPLLPVSTAQIATVLTRYCVSEREAEIVRLLVQGKSYRDIEAELFISIKTVKTHVYNSYKKMGVKSRWQLLNLFQANGGGCSTGG